MFLFYFVTVFPVLTLKTATAADWLTWVSPVAQCAQWSAAKAYSLCEVPKDADNQFKECITRLDIQNAKEIIQTEIRFLENTAQIQQSSLGRDEMIFNQNKEQALALYHRLDIAAITVDYVRACLDSINQVREILDKKMAVSQKPSLKEELNQLKNLTDKFKVNLGAILKARYHYTRGGGIVDRGTASLNAQRIRKKLWGVSVLTEPDYTDFSKEVEEFKGKEERKEITLFLEMVERYKETFNLINKDESTLLNSEEEKGLPYYKKSMSDIFGRSRELTPLNIYSELFEIGTVTTEIIDLQENIPQPLGQTSSTPIPIPARKENSVTTLSSSEEQRIKKQLLKENESKLKDGQESDSEEDLQ